MGHDPAMIKTRLRVGSPSPYLPTQKDWGRGVRFGGGGTAIEECERDRGREIEPLRPRSVWMRTEERRPSCSSRLNSGCNVRALVQIPASHEVLVSGRSASRYTVTTRTEAPAGMSREGAFVGHGSLREQIHHT